MKDYYRVLPDKVRLLNKHYSVGRGGVKPTLIVRHHLAGIGDTEDVWDWWQTRQASAHYVVERDGEVGQLVWDANTAWHAADAAVNRRSYGLEHANVTGSPGWDITDETIISGARLGAALCLQDGMGRPEFGRNVQDHKAFTSTSCPFHLAAGGKYHHAWMEEAAWFYDQLDKRLVNPDGTPVTTFTTTPPSTDTTEEFILSALSPEEQREVLEGLRETREIARELRKHYLHDQPSEVEGSKFAAPIHRYIRLLDRKGEEMHVKMFSEPSAAQEACEADAVAPETYGEDADCLCVDEKNEEGADV